MGMPHTTEQKPSELVVEELILSVKLRTLVMSRQRNSAAEGPTQNAHFVDDNEEALVKLLFGKLRWVGECKPLSTDRRD